MTPRGRAKIVSEADAGAVLSAYVHCRTAAVAVTKQWRFNSMNDRLLRLGGSALVAGSFLLVAVDLVLRFNNGDIAHSNPINIAARVVAIPAGLLLIVGLPAAVAVAARRSLVLSVLGLLLITLSVLIYDSAVALLDAVVLPYLASQHISLSHPPGPMFLVFVGGGFAQITGTILLGIAMFKGRAFAPVAGALLVASGVIMAATVAPLAEWLDSIATVAMMAGLGLAGAQLAGIGPRPVVAPGGGPATVGA
jgi:hypothetical protein